MQEASNAENTGLHSNDMTAEEDEDTKRARELQESEELARQLMEEEVCADFCQICDNVS